MFSLLSAFCGPSLFVGGGIRWVPQRLNLGTRGVRQKMAGGTTFRNPHNLPVKDCVVCGRPFTWRKKWERCWDEVMTCSNRCRTERRHRAKSKDGAVLAGVSAAAAASAGKKVSKSEEANEDAEDSKEPLEGLESEEGVPAAAESALSEGEALEEGTERDAKSAARKERKAALKAMKRERRAQSPKDKADAKRKPCDKCNRSVDLLVRCRIDVSQKWFMLCGRCWHSVSGGVPDGDSEHPHYKYGGLWKNRAAKVTTPSFAGAKVKADLQTLQDTEAE